MKICYIARSAVPSRTANSVHVMKMCQAYARLGHDVTLLLPDHHDGVEKNCDDVYAFYGVQPVFAIRKLPLPKWRLDTLYYSAILPLAGLASRPMLIHSRSLAPAWGMAELYRRQTLLEIHDMPTRTPRQRKLFNRVAASRNLRGIVSTTRALAVEVQPLLPEGVPVFVAPDGVDAEHLQQYMPREEARARLGLSEEKRPIIVYTGHLYRGRGIELIIELARHMDDRLFLIVGGKDEDIAQYRSQTAELTNLRFEGFKPPAQVPLYQYAADALLMPYSAQVATAGGNNSAAFASPMKMFEYLAAGRPILASTLPILREVLRDGDNAFLLPYEEPARWIETLRRLQQDAELQTTMGERALADAHQYTWENRARNLLAQCGY